MVGPGDRRRRGRHHPPTPGRGAGGAGRVRPGGRARRGPGVQRHGLPTVQAARRPGTGRGGHAVEVPGLGPCGRDDRGAVQPARGHPRGLGAAPEHDPDPRRSPWGGMSGAAVWSAGRVIGLVAEHHRSDGLGRLAATRVDRWYERLSPAGCDQLATSPASRLRRTACARWCRRRARAGGGRLHRSGPRHSPPRSCWPRAGAGRAGPVLCRRRALPVVAGGCLGREVGPGGLVRAPSAGRCQGGVVLRDPPPRRGGRQRRLHRGDGRATGRRGRRVGLHDPRERDRERACCSTWPPGGSASGRSGCCWWSTAWTRTRAHPGQPQAEHRLAAAPASPGIGARAGDKPAPSRHPR